MTENNKKKNALLTILFYVISIVIVVAINLSGAFKSGPCTPNLDFLSVFFLAILSVILWAINGILSFGLKKETKYSFFIHSFAISMVILVMPF